jgi:predicted AAA+ superfamily ATPase
MVINRKLDISNIKELLDIFPVVSILGSRQCGKTTLAGEFPYDHNFDLENPQDIAKLAQPQLTLENLTGLILIDEIQRIPDLFSLLRYLVDNNPKQKYLILGSASQKLIKQTSESLTGRVGYYYLGGFILNDVGKQEMNKLWLRGMYPRAFLANSDRQSQLWLQNYVSTFIERDLPQLGIQIPSMTLRRFWAMLGHYHGQVVNFSEIGRAFGMSDNTIRKYLDILESTFMVRLLQPWHVNVGKRLVKRPKIYFRDSGLYHSLMTIQDRNQLLSHNKIGASWEGFALENVSRILQGHVNDLYFWSTHRGAEIDLFWQYGGKNWGIEFKYTDAPKLTKSMQIALEDLNLEYLWIIYPGHDSYFLSKKIMVCPLEEVTKKQLLSS